MFFNSKNIYLYVFALSLVAVASYVGNKFKSQFQDKDEYDLVRQYLLNESPLYGNNKPKIWIHTKYEYNSRVWKSFQSRSSTDLNQPYIHLTIKSIVDHCGDDFHICLIDDNTFSKLIPSWDLDLNGLAEPFKSRARQVGMVELVYYYGGMVLPNSFLCMKNLRDFYYDATAMDKPFVCEGVNRSVNIVRETAANRSGRLSFLPELRIYGANKNDTTIKDLAVYLKEKIQTPQFSNERDLLGEDGYWCLDQIEAEKMNLVGGDVVGVKTRCKKPILIENLLEDEYLRLSTNCVGISIPDETVLARTKYQWFAVMDTRSILDSEFILSKYMKAAVISGNREHLPDRVRNAIAI
jgi:hypothetical protein